MLRHVALVLIVSSCAPVHADAPADGEAVLRKYCVRCHSGPKARGDFDYVADTRKLVGTGLVVPGDAAHSVVYERVRDGEMPPPGAKARPSAAELDALRQWIDAMGATAAPFRRDAEIARVLAADLAQLPVRDRPHARWLTLTHLANAGVAAEQLERYRTALGELLASLTWSAAPPVPVAVDAERTIFRIDLRDLGWTAATWDQIRASYPYGVARGSGVPDAIRADWFVATASRAPLYHAILGLPDTEAGLARRLGIDLADDIARGRVVRAGFNSSGVSINNRVIERHATRHGALWRSYDFKSSVERENVFAHPLDFVPAGGEIIFNLPDGFQAYMLVNATGHRIDKAPTAIVSDPKRPDRSVETAISCIGCHATGIVDRADQIRDAAGKLDERVAALYPRRDVLAAAYTSDRQRFTDALAQIHAVPDAADEPITALDARYEAELDLRLAAAELGLLPVELEARLHRSTELEQTLGAFIAGGTIKRDSWEALFPRIASELGVAVPFTPRTNSDRTPLVWIDGERRTWLVLDGTADQATASAACRRRALELPRATELAAAMGRGLATAIDLDQPVWSGGTRLDAANQRFAQAIDAAGTSHRADVAERHRVVCLAR